MADKNENMTQQKVSSIFDNPQVASRVATSSLTANESAAVRVANSMLNSLGGASNLGGSSGSGSFVSDQDLSSGHNSLASQQYMMSRYDRLAMYRHWTRVDPYVGRAIELHSELPLSRITIQPPSGWDQDKNLSINRIYENLVDRIDMLDLLLDIAREYWSVGDIYLWHQWDEETQEWSDVYVLPTEYCNTILHPFNRSKEVNIFARPLFNSQLLPQRNEEALYSYGLGIDLEGIEEELEEEIPDELKEALIYGEGMVLNSDPSKGSYVYHISRNRSPNEPYGSPLLERCVETLMRIENLKNAQYQISSRNMNPKHLVYGEDLSPDEVNELRSQVDLSMFNDLDYPIVTNFPVHWEVVGANERLLNVDGEYSQLLDSLAVGLATTKEMLTGSATYGSQRITLELMNTQYLNFREVIKKYVEKGIFQPVAEAKGHYYHEEIDVWLRVEVGELKPGDEVLQEIDGSLRKKVVQTNKVYNHSELRFNRLSVRDNSEVYEQLFQLHQKGNLSLKYLLDLHNIDTNENANSLLEDMGTVKDPNFNRLMESLYSIVAEPVVENTDFTDRVIKGMELKTNLNSAPVDPDDLDASEMPDLGGGVATGMETEGGLAAEEATDTVLPVAKGRGKISSKPFKVTEEYLTENRDAQTKSKKQKVSTSRKRDKGTSTN